MPSLAKKRYGYSKRKTLAGGVVVKGGASLDKRGRVERKLASGPIAFSTGSIRCL